jgi:RNA polymerase sigma-70 factor (ECF subfamily)
MARRNEGAIGKKASVGKVLPVTEQPKKTGPKTTGSPVDPDDLELVRRANDGDATAMRAIYDRHKTFVFAVAMQVTKNREDAGDVVQETFAYLFSRFPGFSLTAPMRGYLYPVAKNKSISILRKRKKVVPLDMNPEFADALLGGVEQQHSEDYRRLIAGLSDTHKEVVALRFGQDMRVPEIAKALDLPLGTVKSRLHNALKSLKTKFFSDEVEKSEESGGAQ